MIQRARILHLVLVVMLAALAAPAPASAAPVNVNETLTGTVTWATGWCCGTYVEFEGNAVAPAVGAVAFTGTRSSGCAGPPSPFTQCFRRLTLTLFSSKRHVLVLSGNNEWLFPLDPLPEELSWSVDQAESSGRFADFSGSGTYTFDRVDNTVIISLSGTLERERN